jgi:hypothetical protein
VTGMSNGGRIVGRCVPAGTNTTAGFLMESPSSTATLLTGQHGEAIVPCGINDHGQIAGMMS